MITHPVLTELAGAGIRLGLTQIRDFLRAMGEPHLAVPVVHIAGTNGKGSVCHFVRNVLQDAGYRTGMNLSPHLEDVNERIQVNGESLSDAALVEAIEAIDRGRRTYAETQQLSAAPLTYFEFMTAAAFWAFKRHQCDVAVIETGLGGRLDATNVVEPVVTAVTSIGLDHADQLGDTLGAIAGEKAGIFKRGAPAVIGGLAPEARAVCEGRAKALGVPLWRPGKHMSRELMRDGRWSLRTLDGPLPPVKLQLEGDHQGGNALVALGVLHQLRRIGFHIPDEAIVSGFERTVIPGRIERLDGGLVVDGAHNLDGAKALAAWLAKQPRPDVRILLWGMGDGRDADAIIQPLLPLVDEVVTTRCAHPKARDPYELALDLQNNEGLALSAGGDIEQTLPECYADADETIVAGSLYLAGAARSLFHEGLLEGLVPGEGLPEDLELADAVED